MACQAQNIYYLILYREFADPAFEGLSLSFLGRTEQPFVVLGLIFPPYWGSALLSTWVLVYSEAFPCWLVGRQTILDLCVFSSDDSTRFWPVVLFPRLGEFLHMRVLLSTQPKTRGESSASLGAFFLSRCTAFCSPVLPGYSHSTLPVNSGRLASWSAQLCLISSSGCVSVPHPCAAGSPQAGSWAAIPLTSVPFPRGSLFWAASCPIS